MTLYTAVSADKAALAARCVEVLEALGHKAMESYGRFIVSLAGGSTPVDVYTLWARESTLDWSRVALVFGDERCVPPDHEQSNYRMVADTLLSHLPVQPQVLRMGGEAEDPAQAAFNYDYALRQLVQPEGRIHVALLGLGTDGHTASLFPGTDALREGDSWCAATQGAATEDGATGMQRITLTVPCLREARKLVFIAAGQEKAAIIAELLQGPLHPEQWPAQFFLRDERINANLMLDAAAAAGLSLQG